jgi:hypothetical protein
MFSVSVGTNTNKFCNLSDGIVESNRLQPTLVYARSFMVVNLSEDNNLFRRMNP